MLSNHTILLGFLCVAGAACRSSDSNQCEAALLQAVETYASTADAEHDERATYARWVQACPQANPVVVRALGRFYSAPSLTAQFGKAYWAELYKACQFPRAWADALENLELVEAQAQKFELCNYQRFGLLEPHEKFSIDDDAAFQAFAYFSRAGHNKAMLRRLMRATMFETASEATLIRRCYDDHKVAACVSLSRRRGLELPDARRMTSHTEDPTVFVSADALKFRGQRFAWGRQNPAYAHLVPGLHKLMKSGELWNTKAGGRRGVVLVMDKTMLAGDVVDLLFTATRFDTVVSILTRGPSEFEHTPLTGPPHWLSAASFAKLDPAYRRPSDFVLNLERDIVRAHGQTEALWVGDERFTDWVAGQRTTQPGLTSVELFIEEATTLQQLLALVSQWETGWCGPWDNQCAAPVLRIDLRQPVHERPGNWTELRVEVEELSVYQVRKKVALTRRLRRDVNKSLSAIETCLRGDRLMAALRPATVNLFLTVRSGALELARVDIPGYPQLDGDCLHRRAGLGGEGPRRTAEVNAVVELSVKLPGE